MRRVWLRNILACYSSSIFRVEPSIVNSEVNTVRIFPRGIFELLASILFRISVDVSFVFLRIFQVFVN